MVYKSIQQVYYYTRLDHTIVSVIEYNECSIKLSSFSKSGLILCTKPENEFASLIFLLHKKSLSIVIVKLS